MLLIATPIFVKILNLQSADIITYINASQAGAVIGYNPIYLSLAACGIVFIIGLAWLIALIFVMFRGALGAVANMFDNDIKTIRGILNK
jgi:uncharacterized membrane protein YdbT with pleckstrin-like domain